MLRLALRQIARMQSPTLLRTALCQLFVTALCFLPAITWAAVDDDGDGMSDVWQRVHNIPTGSGSEDLDGDGLSNLLESQFGTNPRLNGFPNRFVDAYGLPTAAETNGFVSLRWFRVPGIRYQLQSSTTLTNWATAGPSISGTSGAIVRVTFTSVPVSSVSKLFFRLALLPRNDADGDGLDAFEEWLLGTSDQKADTDGDRLSDRLEFRQHLNPLSNVSGDGDAIPDDWEIFHFGSTTPLPESDPDGDGFSNRDEFEFGLNPNLNDFANGVATHRYSYDRLGRLMTVTDGALSESFAYDPEGNLTNSH